MRLCSLIGVVPLALVLGLLFGWISGIRWSSWPETVSAVALVVAACFLAGISIGGFIRGPYARTVVIAFALTFLIWPAWNGMLRPLSALEFFAILEVLPTLAGGLMGIALQRSGPGTWWVITAAVGAASITAIGPPR